MLEAEQTHKAPLLDPAKATPSEFLEHFQACTNTLRQKRGKPRDHQVRELLHQYYMMHQSPNESIAEFANRFTETQFNLEKLIPNIHRIMDSKDTNISPEIELIHAFVIKLKDSISKKLISRDFPFKTLQSVIEAAEGYEHHADPVSQSDVSDWHPDVMYSHANAHGHEHYKHSKPSDCENRFSDFKGKPSHSDSMSHKPTSSCFNKSNTPRSQPIMTVSSGDVREKEICLAFNKYPMSSCQLPQNKCRYKRQHKCKSCGQWGCKALNHRPNSVGPHANITSSVENVQSDGLKTGHCGDNSTMTQRLGSIQQTMQSFSARLEKIEGFPQSSSNIISPSSVQPEFLQAPAYGCPAITSLPNHLPLSELNLAHKRILWTLITSAGVSLPLPLDSCCSLSLVSKTHADLVCEKYPNLKFTRLPNPIPVAVATPNSQLKAIGILQVPHHLGKWKTCFFCAYCPRLNLTDFIQPKSITNDQSCH